MMAELLVKLLVPMAIAGSAAFVLILLLRPALRRAGAHLHKSALLTVAALFLLPLPLVSFFFTPGTDDGAVQTALPFYTAGEALGAVLETDHIAPPSADATMPAASKSTAGAKPASNRLAMLASKVSFLNLAVALYLVGLLVATAAWLVQYYSFLSYIKRESHPVTNSKTLALYKQLCQELEIKNAPALLTGPSLHSPLLAGLRKPHILLPSDIEAAPESLLWALRHELCHYKHGDLFAKQLVQIAVILHWFNPLAYLLRRMVGQACEESCDEAITTHLDAKNRQSYAMALLACASGPAPYAAAGFSSSARRLKRRIEHMLKPRRIHPALKISLLCLLAAVFCVGAFAGCSMAAGALGATNQENDPTSFTQPESVPEPESDPAPESQPESLPNGPDIGVGIIGGADGPTSIFITSSADDGTVYHFNTMPLFDGKVVSLTDGTVRQVLETEELWAVLVYDIENDIYWLYYDLLAVEASEGSLLTTGDIIGTSLFEDTYSIAAVKSSKEEGRELVKGWIESEFGSAPKEASAYGEAPAGKIEPPENLPGGEYIWPVPKYTGTSRGFSDYHYGLDINGVEGMGIYSIADGEVLVSEYTPTYGNYMVIEHEDGFQSLYSHCSTLEVEAGSTVEAGQLIATVGNTGNSTGHHCHLELYQNGERVDPTLYLTSPTVTFD